MRGRPWTREEDQYMRDHYPDELGNDITRALGRSRSAMYGRATLLGLQKSDFFKLSERSCRLTGEQGEATRFKKGHISHNKGKKMSDENYEKAKATMFKSGQMPHNHRHVGTISDRSGSLYLKIAEPKRWVKLHRYNWEKAFGPIPSEMNLVFKDGNYLNCQVKNLELITNDELMKRNTIHKRYPEELKKAILLLGTVKRKVREYEE